MIQFIYGKNIFAIDQMMKKIVADFQIVDPSNMNLEKLDGSGLTAAKFAQAVSSMPFLAAKRLAIVENLLLENKDLDLKNTIADQLAAIAKSKTIELIIIERGEPDKRLRLYKNLLKNAGCFEAKQMEGILLNQWVAAQFKDRGVEIGRSDVEFLISEVGGEMLRLAAEIEKISLYVHSQKREKLERMDIELLACAEINPNIFHFTEAIARRDAKTASKLLYQFMSQGESEQKLLGTLIYQFRTLIMIKDALDRGMSSGQLSSAAKVSPYVVNKNISIAKSKPLRTWIQMFDQLRRTDSAIKSGEIAPEAATDILVTTLCR